MVNTTASKNSRSFLFDFYSKSTLKEVGDYWQGSGMYLEILPDGTFDYQRGGTSISSSVDEFDGDNFLVDMLIMNTTFEVSQPPFFSDGQWLLME
ncbi:hypothetical protein [Pseudoalteromonas arctica]|uniref:Uncharacterized protein n=1 Tax=Pseudoalteromonas arctica TaxID=394751 RepID=A0A7Y0DVS0_9GAMM|nr:hypothetical protein [Pseudoalteromonas arctica]NMM42477.1 hypothetical protein [Pseudoalteromonas arctica]